MKVVKRPEAKRIFRSLLTDDKKKKLGPPLNCSTRWNSTLHVVERAFEMRHDLKKYFTLHGSTDMKKTLLLEKEWDEIRELVEFLTPMQQTTVDRSAAAEPTFHVGKLYLTRLALHLRQSSELPTAIYSQADIPRKTAKAMEDKLTRISPDSWQQDVVKVALRLDPCIKTSLVPDTAGELATSDLLKKFCALYKTKVTKFRSRQHLLPCLPAPSEVRRRN
ncbi:hypothetical protein RvY_11538-1 [Ramazzottius varieornatus]|uniref:HAT C-terminal dimerisation domain-containing protein n=1 Tax=Ramazzottius varieornatus TaxID=947166 RepID=A0A1D1VGH8_RAMVA|nr:hypothetical protein RvY_11538-1 [Ramazzottius varieornatus]